MLTHRQNARQKARRWQIAAAACFALAVASFFVPLDWLLTPKKVGVVTADPATALPAEQPFTTPNVGSAILTLNELFPRLSPAGPGEEDEEPTEHSQTKADIPAPPPPPIGQWEYIGSIITPTSKRAFVRVDQQQHLLAEGAGVNATKVVAITANELTIETEGVRKVVALNTRTMDFPTTQPKKPVAFRTPPTIGAPGTMAMSRPGVPPGPGVVPGAGMATPPPQAPASFDAQMRAQAMQEAARRGQAGAEMPRRMSGEQAEMMRKMLTDGGLDPAQKREMLQKMGIKAGTPTDQTLQQLKESGVELDDSVMGAAKELEGMGGDHSEEELKKAEEAGKGG